MNLAKKLQTAKKVFFERGIKEVFVLTTSKCKQLLSRKLNVLFRKLRTAKNTFCKHGMKEVLHLLQKNIENFLVRISEFFNSKVRRFIANHIGSSLNRKIGDELKVLYITDLMESRNGQTIRYRIWNLKVSLKDRAEVRVEILENGIYKDRNYLKNFDLVIIMRVMWSQMLERLVETLKEDSIPVVFDMDDIIFLPEYAKNFCHVLQETTIESFNFYTGIFHKYEVTFQNADYATASTAFIADKMRQEGKTAYIIHNGLNEKQLQISQKIQRVPEKPIRYIGYLSGTNTHNQDFLQALPAIEKILDEYDDVQLRIVGYLDLAVLKPSAAAKTETLPFMKWPRLLKESSDNYINIAPLEIENPFCHAKSELKYFESAIVGIPTVASATDTFKRCITHGVNGMLASNSEEWYTALKLLLDDRSFYNNISKNAYKHVMDHYAPDAIADEAIRAYHEIIRHYKESSKQTF